MLGEQELGSVVEKRFEGIDGLGRFLVGLCLRIRS